MSFEIKDIDKIATLAALKLGDEEKIEFSSEISKVLDLFKILDKVDVEGIEPMAHPLEMTQKLAEDEAESLLERDYLQKIAPKTKAGLYLVPKVIE